jgi:uncharacterized repeat protein (TIGR01451 family)
MGVGMNEQQRKGANLLAWALGLVALMMFFNTAAATNSPAKPDATSKARLAENYGKLPLSFEVNQGQTDKKARFLSRGPGYGLFLTPTAAVLSLHKPKAAAPENSKSPGQTPKTPAGKTPESSGQTGPEIATTLHMQLLGANPDPKTGGLDELPGKVNYFRGKDPKQWHTHIPTYAKVKYEKVYPGIDLIYYGNQRQLEYDFIVAPGADPKAVRLAFEGADKLNIDAQGDLLLHMAGGDMRLHKPLVYQEIDGKRREIDGRYLLHRGKDKAKVQVGFRVAAYDKDQPLIIDPVLTYSTFLGGSDYETATSIAVDSAGNAYVTGITLSTDFPTTLGALDTSHNGSPGFPRDVFVTKLNAAGSGLVFSTYLGGDGNDVGNSVAVDAVGNAYVTGETASTNFPTTLGAYDQSFNSTSFAGPDAFVAKFSASGSLVYSTYLGGSGNDAGLSIAVDTSSNAYVTGYTLGPFFGPGFPTTPGAFGQSSNGNVDAFVTKLNADGSALVYSSHLGGDGRDIGNGIAVDSAGNAYVTGETGIASSTKFPTPPGAYQTSYKGGNSDVFITKVNAAGSGLVYSTFVGGSGNDIGNSIALDPVGNAYVTGSVFFNPTDVHNFPTTPGAFKVSVSDQVNGFVTKLNAGGSALIYSTYLGGTSEDCSLISGCHIAVDTSGNAYVTGTTRSSDFPTTAGAYDTSFNGFEDVFLTKLNGTGTVLVYSTFIGSIAGDAGNAIALDTAGNVYVAGYTDNGFSTPPFPTTAGTLDTSYNGLGDAFIAKFSGLGPPPPGADLSVTKTDAPDPISVGNELVYTITVKNAGPLTATGVKLTDTLPASVGFVSVSSGCSRSGSTVTCALGTLPKGGIATILLTVRPTAMGAVGIKATVSAAELDPNPANNTSTTVTTVQPIPTGQADVSVKKTGPSAASLGQRLDYTLTVKNNGPAAATGVMLKDTLPAGLLLLSKSPACAASGSTVSCALGSLNSGASTTVTISANVDNPPGAQVSNIATVRSNQTDPTSANNTSTVSTTINKSGINLNVSLKGSAGFGQVVSDPAGIDCSNVPGAVQDCVQNYATGANTLVTLFATPKPGYRFAGWEKACAGEQAAVCVRSMLTSLQVVANFTKETNTEGPVKALLLLHGMNTSSATWNDFIQLPFNSACARIFAGVREDPDAVNASNGVLCYRIDFGNYDFRSDRIGLEVLTPAQAAIDGQPIAGDFSTFRQLGLEVRAAVSAILRRHPNAEIVLLGHSRGGLAARAFLQQTSPERDNKSVVGLVTIGTPHLGTRLGRIYQYLKNHPCKPRSNCSTNPDLTEDWHIVDSLRNLPLALQQYRLDLRKPTIGDLDDRSLPETGRVTVASLNAKDSIGQLPREIKYGELLYTGVDLGWLYRSSFKCYIFGDAFPLDLCPDVSSVLQGYLLLPQGIPSAFPGDGIVPLASQRYLAIPEFPADATKRYPRYGKANTLHTEEPKQEMDINGILTQMMGTWWTTR